MAVANPDSDTITLRLGQAGGGFGAQRIFSVGDRPGPIAAGDIDSDGLVDLVIGLQYPAPMPATGRPAEYALSILRGTGDATLFVHVPGPPIFSTTAISTVVTQLTLADYTGDRVLDALIGADTTHFVHDFPPTFQPGQFVVASPGVGDTPFAEVVNSAAGTTGGSPAIGVVDLDLDGTVMVMGGVGRRLQFRSLTEPVPPSFEYPDGNLTGLVAADFNGDGLFDVAASHASDASGTGGISILYSAGDETGLRRLRWAAEGDYVALKGAEMTGDGRPDIVALAPTGTVAILQGSPIGLQSSAVDVGAPTTSFGVTDVNGDGMTDLAVTTDSGVIVLLQRAPISPALVDDLETQVSGLQQQIALKGAAIQELTAQVEELTGDNLELQNLIDQLTADLEAANDTIAARNTTIGLLEAQVRLLTDERDDLADANGTLQGLLDTANAAIGALTTERNDLASANAALQGQLDTANNRIDVLTTERDSLVSANAALQELLDSANSAIATLTTERNDLAAAHAAVQAQLNSANDTIAAQQTTIGNLSSQIEALTSERNSLAAANSALQGQLTAANGTIAAQQTTIENLQTQLAAANQAVANLTAQLANATADFTAQIAVLQQALQVALADPSFVIPGATPQAQIQNLVTAIAGLNPGQKLALYKNLGGKTR